jgi:hypothetical protein
VRVEHKSDTLASFLDTIAAACFVIVCAARFLFFAVLRDCLPRIAA